MSTWHLFTFKLFGAQLFRARMWTHIFKKYIAHWRWDRRNWKAFTWLTQSSFHQYDGKFQFHSWFWQNSQAYDSNVTANKPCNYLPVCLQIIHWLFPLPCNTHWSVRLTDTCAERISCILVSKATFNETNRYNELTEVLSLQTTSQTLQSKPMARDVFIQTTWGTSLSAS